MKENNPKPRFHKKRQPKKVSEQTKVLIHYALEDNKRKKYNLKNVISFVIKGKTKSLNITYKKQMGKIKLISNVIIPFSELSSVIFSSSEKYVEFYFDGEELLSRHDYKFVEDFSIQL